MYSKTWILFPSKADPDVWMRPAKDEAWYEYIAVNVDDATTKK